MMRFIRKLNLAHLVGHPVFEWQEHCKHLGFLTRPVFGSSWVIIELRSTRYPPTWWGNIRNHFTGVRGESKRSKAISLYPQTYVGSTDKRRNVMNMILPSFEEDNAVLSGINTL